MLGGWGGGERAPSFGEGVGVGSEIFGDLLGQNLSFSHNEKCISFFGRGMPPQTSILLQFQIVFFTAKRHSENNYSSITKRKK